MKQLRFELSLPTTVLCGEDVVEDLGRICADLGQTFLLVTAAGLGQAGTRVLSILESARVDVETYQQSPGEPTCALVDELARKCERSDFDTIIGLGGGSAIDLAKALSIAITNPEPIWNYCNLSNRPPSPLEHPPLGIIAIPTTSGTGSEVTPYAVMTNTETRQKGTIQERSIFPRVAFVDPSLTRSMGRQLTAATGLDAFAHALESYINIARPSVVSEWAARESLRLIFEFLPRAYDDGDDSEARQSVAWASTLGGVAIAHRGTTVGHAIAEPLGALTHLPHAISVALCTIPVLRATGGRIPERIAQLHEGVFGSSPKAGSERAAAFLSETERLFEKLEMKKSLSALGVAESGLAQSLLADVLAYKFRPLAQHPVRFSEAELAAIIGEIVGEEGGPRIDGVRDR
jgi:alcohol dehydrogenase class IV